MYKVMVNSARFVNLTPHTALSVFFPYFFEYAEDILKMCIKYFDVNCFYLQQFKLTAVHTLFELFTSSV